MVLCLDVHELASVQQRVDGAGWVSEVGRHQRDWRRRKHVITPTQGQAIKWAERWTRANLERIQSEMPTRGTGPNGVQLIFPLSNPPVPF